MRITLSPSRRRLALLLGALSAFPPVTIDLYLPGLPAMARDLHAEAGLVQLSVTVFVVGLALGQLVVGPLSDAHGRRPLLLGGLVAYVAGSLARWRASWRPRRSCWSRRGSSRRSVPRRRPCSPAWWPATTSRVAS